MSEPRYTLTFACPDTVGLVAAVTTLTASFNGWIVEAAQHADPDSGRFFMRQEIRVASVPFGVEELRRRFGLTTAEELSRRQASEAIDGLTGRVEI